MLSGSVVSSSCDCSLPSSSVQEIFLSQEYWSRLPFPTPGDLPDPGIKPVSFESPALAGGFLARSHPRSPRTTLDLRRRYKGHSVVLLARGGEEAESGASNVPGQRWSE